MPRRVAGNPSANSQPSKSGQYINYGGRDHGRRLMAAHSTILRACLTVSVRCPIRQHTALPGKGDFSGKGLTQNYKTSLS